MGNYITNKTIDVIIHPYPNLSLTIIVKEAQVIQWDKLLYKPLLFWKSYQIKMDTLIEVRIHHKIDACLYLMNQLYSTWCRACGFCQSKPILELMMMTGVVFA